MKILKLDQGTPEWLKWRKTIITGTDCPAIMGSSPFKTAYKCWQQKLGLVQEEKMNAAMQRGVTLEPEARANFIQKMGQEMNPACAESSEHAFLGASLDGISPCSQFILEIKCGGDKLYESARRGDVPEYYMDQMQHQLLVTGANCCYYYCYNGTTGVTIEIKPDKTFADRFLPRAREFWRSITFFEQPPLAPGDYKNMNDNLPWKEYADQYKEIDAIIKASEERKDYLRKKLIEMCGNEPCQGGGVKVLKVISKGRVVYDDIPEIKGVDLNKYRKEATSAWRLTVEAPALPF